MPNYRRSNLAGACYFFTVNTLRRLPLLVEADVPGGLAGVTRPTTAALKARQQRIVEELGVLEKFNGICSCDFGEVGRAANDGAFEVRRAVFADMQTKAAAHGYSEWMSAA